MQPQNAAERAQPEYRPPSVAGPLYRAIALAAIPGTLWSAFEMYLLTLKGPQMLFFSIVHTMPLMVIFVLVGVVALALWMVQSALALVLPRYGAALGVTTTALTAFVLLSGLQLALLYWYEEWSSSNLRIAISLLGLATVGLLLWLTVRLFRRKIKDDPR
jgi:hypothetical protein